MRRPRTKLLVILFLILASIGISGYVGVKNAMADPVKRAAFVELTELPGDVKPIRIALLSDIHVGNFVMRPERLSVIVDQVNKAKPDIVLLAGDFVIGESAEGTSQRALNLAPLAQLRAPGGVFAALGNHDHWTDVGAVRLNLEKAGVKVLENEAVRRGAIAIVGIGDRFSGHDDVAKAVANAKNVGGVPIAFTHSPDLSPDLPKNFPVLLAGHTHCGQMVAPLFGPIVRYSKWRRLYNPKYRCGMIRDDFRTTFVTAGVGSGAVPLRFGAMPDWWLITLRSHVTS